MTHLPTDYSQYYRDHLVSHKLSKKETNEVILKAQDGCKESRNTVVMDNMPLVVHISFEFNRRYTFKGTIDDLIQEGSLGLVLAIDKYNPEKGVKFSTYAIWWVKARLLHYVMTYAKVMKVGTTQLERTLFYKAAKLLPLLELPEEERIAALEKVARDYKCTLKQVQAALSKISPSNESGIVDEKYQNFIHSCGCESQQTLERIEMHKAVRKGLKSTFLTKRERYVLQERFCETPRTLGDIGDELGLSRERIRQIEKKALETLKRILKRRL